MKKVLLATTMLVAGASIAAAEVTLSGDARMGLVNNFVHGAGVDATQFTSRARVAFTLSGESDSGLSFGASFRADNAAGAAAGTAGSVFISGAFGRLSMGDVDGAAQMAVGHVDGVGLTGLGDQNENAFIGAGGFAFGALSGVSAAGAATALTGDPTALYTYSAGAFSVFASVTQPNFRVTIPAGNVADTGFPGAPAFAVGNVVEGDAVAIGAAYELDAYRFSFGYEKMALDRRTPAAPALSIDIDHLVLGADATFGQVEVKARYGKADMEANNVAVAEFEQAALSATYTMDAIGVTGFVRESQWSLANGANLRDVKALGLGASYDLGGGATVRGGIVKQSIQVGAAAKTSDTAFDLGVAFSF